MLPPVGFAELLLILGVVLGTFLLAFIFRVARGWWRRWRR